MEDKSIFELIAEYSTGTISPADAELLRARLESDAEAMRLFREIRETEKVLKSVQAQEKIDLQKSWKRLTEMEPIDKELGYQRIVRPVKMQTRHRRMIRLIGRCAAVVILLVVTAGLLFDWGGRSEVVSIPVTPIVSGHNTAKLILAGGSEIVLDTLVSEVELEKFGMTIRKNNKGVTYERVDPMDDQSIQLVYDILEVPRGGKYDIVLEDGTRVWLNADSRLRYPRAFPAQERRVYLEGEAFFEVHRDTARPFFVETEEQTLRVLGTTFNLYAYTDEAVVYTTLVEGSVSVSDNKGGNSRILVPGDQSQLNVKNGEFVIEKVDVQQVTSWRKDMFVFEEQTLEQIMVKLSRWYNVRVFYRDETVKKITFKGNLPRYSDFLLVLNALEKTSGYS